jgi:hypothetical protein
MTVKKTKKPANTELVIKAPNIKKAEFTISGTAPYVQLRFSEKAMNAIAEKMLGGSTSVKKKQHAPRDFDEDFRQAQHVSEEGWVGMPASAFRAAIVSACRLVGFKMTIAKLSVFVHNDGLDRVDAVPLIKIKGTPKPLRMHVRNASGVCDLRVRARFDPWSAVVPVSYDADQFSLQDVTNLMHRVGCQVGIGEGRPDSKASTGMGWGTFEISNVKG